MSSSGVIVVGAGPAGRALSARLAVHGADVTLVDPHPDRAWAATYAGWGDELPTWIDASVFASVNYAVRVHTRSPTEVARRYVVFDSAALQRSLPLTGVEVVTARAVAVRPDGVDLDDRTTRTGLVVDARGTGRTGPRQTAFGIVVTRDVAAPLLAGADAVLMDWRSPGPLDDERPSFLYAVPLDAQRVLLEETCLAGDPALAPSVLHARLRNRLAMHGLSASEKLGTERVSYGLTGIDPKPWRSKVILFGARAGLMHPATGYSVGASLASADQLAVALASGDDPVDALWPRPARVVHRLRLIGLHALLDFDTDEMAEFFEAFFALPARRQRTYLSDRTDAAGVITTMAGLFGTARGQRGQLMRAALAEVSARMRANPGLAGTSRRGP